MAICVPFGWNATARTAPACAKNSPLILPSPVAITNSLPSVVPNATSALFAAIANDSAVDVSGGIAMTNAPVTAFDHFTDLSAATVRRKFPSFEIALSRIGPVWSNSFLDGSAPVGQTRSKPSALVV